MQNLKRPRKLRRSNIMLNSFASRVSNTPEKFSWAPEVSMSEIISQPRMLSHQFESTIAFKQLQCSRNTHCWRQFNKQMDMVNSNMQLIDFTFMSFSRLTDEPFTVNLNSKKFEGVHGIFRLPYEMESILPEGMVMGLQIHFLSPAQQRARELMLSECLVFIEGNVSPHETKEYQELNHLEDGNSSLCLKAEVSLPYM
jgi:hypothetical protein